MLQATPIQNGVFCYFVVYLVNGTLSPSSPLLLLDFIKVKLFRLRRLSFCPSRCRSRARTHTHIQSNTNEWIFTCDWWLFKCDSLTQLHRWDPLHLVTFHSIFDFSVVESRVNSIYLSLICPPSSKFRSLLLLRFRFFYRQMGKIGRLNYRLSSVSFWTLNFIRMTDTELMLSLPI